MAPGILLDDEPAIGDANYEDPYVHIVFSDTPDKALCGITVSEYEWVGDDGGPECPDCGALANWWRSLEP